MTQRIERMKRIYTLIIVGLFLLQIACQAFEGLRPTEPAPVSPADTAPGATQPAVATAPVEASIPETMSSGETDRACAGSFGYGVTCLENNEWINYNKDNTPISSDLIKDIDVCPGGDLLVLHALGLNRFDGTQWRSYDQGWGHESSEAAACATDGDFWVAHFRGVSHFHDGVWQMYTVKETLSTDPDAYERVNDIAIAPDGGVWVVTVNSVAVFDDETWTVYEEGSGFADKYFFERIAFDSKGNPWVVSGSGLHHRAGRAWDFYPNRDISLPKSLTVDSQDRVWVGTLSGGLLLFENQSWLTYTPQNSPLSSYNVSALAVDAAGRLWVGTAWGLHIVDGDTWTVYHMSNSDLPDDNIAVIAVAGTGPALPAAQQKAPGTLTGRLVGPDGEALANAALEICVETIYSSYRGATPCEDHPYTRDAVSDADGAFTIENLPAGFYNLAVQTGDTWMLYSSRSRGSSERFIVPAGETVDLGEITVSTE